jgi:hypothetical protein
VTRDTNLESAIDLVYAIICNFGLQPSIGSFKFCIEFMRLNINTQPINRRKWMKEYRLERLIVILLIEGSARSTHQKKCSRDGWMTAGNANDIRRQFEACYAWCKRKQ